jgi:hypothetical protein
MVHGTNNKLKEKFSLMARCGWVYLFPQNSEKGKQIKYVKISINEKS